MFVKTICIVKSNVKTVYNRLKTTALAECKMVVLKAPSRPHPVLSTATMLLPRARFQTRYLVSVSCDVKGNTLIDPCWNGTYTQLGVITKAFHVLHVEM